MTTIEVLHKNTSYSAVRPHVDPSQNAHWCFMHSAQVLAEPDYRPCFNPRLMTEMHDFLRRTTNQIERSPHGQLSHVILASDADVFNLGGDLRLFAKLIREKNRTSLLKYARDCIEGVYSINSNLHTSAHTVALLQGDALGGGLELALSCRTVIAESGVHLGFPEVLFGLFPGMGAYHLISRKLNAKIAEDMMTSGIVYTSDDLHKLGLVDILVEKGEGVAAVNEFIRRNKRISATRLSLNNVRNAANPLSFQELLDVTEIWVESALSLSERSLKTMERLVAAQNKRYVNRDEYIHRDAPVNARLRAAG